MVEIRDIPKHWQIKTLDDICEFTQGIQVDINKQKDTAFENCVRFLRIIDFTQTEEPPRYIENPGERYLLKKGEIAMVRYGTVGFVCIGKEGAIANNLFKIKPKEFIASKYLINFLKSLLFISKLETKGATMQALSFGLIKPIPFPFPPLPEQQLIVSKIEELLSDLDNGKQQLHIAKQQLKVYRQSLLKWAFEGKLTNKNVKEGELPKSWKVVKVSDVCKCIVPNRDKPKSFSGHIKWVTTPNLSSSSIRLNYNDIAMGLSEVEVKEYNARVIPVGSVIMTCVGTFGLSAIVEKPIVINQQLHAFISSDLVNSKYLAYCIQNSKHFFEKKSTSTTIQYLNKENCNSMPLPLCSIDEQTKIVEELESKLTVCDKIEETISQSLLQAETLRQSILKKAFEGKLVSLNYDSDDEVDKHEMRIAAEEPAYYKKRS